MSRLTKLHRNPGHDLVDNHDFILRLYFKKTGELPVKADYVNLSLQYVALYEALELRLAQLIDENTLYLNFFNKEPWVDRSEQLKNDVREMKTLLSDREKTAVMPDDIRYPALERMIKTIATADPVSLFAFFSVRCVNDALNGAAFNRSAQTIYGNAPLKGTFYATVEEQQNSLSHCINDALLTAIEEEQFHQAVNEFLQLHHDLFNQMEEGRVLPQQPFTRPIQHKNTCRYTLFALSALGLMTAAGSLYCGSMYQPDK